METTKADPTAMRDPMDESNDDESNEDMPYDVVHRTILSSQMEMSEGHKSQFVFVFLTNDHVMSHDQLRPNVSIYIGLIGLPYGWQKKDYWQTPKWLA